MDIIYTHLSKVYNNLCLNEHDLNENIISKCNKNQYKLHCNFCSGHKLKPQTLYIYNQLSYF